MLVTVDDLVEVFSCRRLPAFIEPEPFDDEDGHGFDPLDRWGDRVFNSRNRSFITEYKASDDIA